MCTDSKHETIEMVLRPVTPQQLTMLARRFLVGTEAQPQRERVVELVADCNFPPARSLLAERLTACGVTLDAVQIALSTQAQLASKRAERSSGVSGSM